MNKFHLEKYCIPIIRKGVYTKKSLEFSKNSFNNLLIENKPCYLLQIEGEVKDKNLNNYLKRGIEEGINKRYKCGTYKPNWFNIPSIGGSKLIFFKRGHIAPKLIYNTKKIDVTDSGYRITLNEEKYAKEFQYCFYNSFTLLMMELGGRTYGGGVLEVTPNEFKKLPIPFIKDISKEELINFNKKDLSKIDEILLNNDEYLFKKKMKLSDEKIIMIQKIREKLLKKRLKK